MLSSHVRIEFACIFEAGPSVGMFSTECLSYDASNFMTGSYNNLFRVGNINTDPNKIVEEYSVNSPSHVYQATIDPNDLHCVRKEMKRGYGKSIGLTNSLNSFVKSCFPSKFVNNQRENDKRE